MAQESDIALSAEIEELDDVKSSIVGLRFVRSTSVPRWAVEEPDILRIIPYQRYFDAVAGGLDDEELP